MKKQVEFKPTLTNKIQRKKLASSIMKNAFRIGNKLIAWIPVELLNIQPYQRNRQNHVNKIAENWDDAKCNVLLVSYDEVAGWFNIINGQHRAIAARMRGVEYLVCEIFTGLSKSQEAKIFAGQGDNTKKLTPFDTYRANQFIEGEEETELSQIDKRIAAVCKEYNVIVEKSNAKGTLKSITEARAIMKRDGEAGLEFVFDVIQGSHWDGFKSSYAGDLMSSLGKIYFTHKDNLEEVKKCLCGFLITSTPEELTALSNNTYPNLTRRARLDAILADVINEPEPTKPVKKKGKVAKIA